MTCGDSFVAEDTTEFKDSFKATDEHSLQVQLCRDAEVELHVQRVVVGNKGPRVGAACSSVRGMEVRV